jgi:hypothetical protein
MLRLPHQSPAKARLFRFVVLINIRNLGPHKTMLRTFSWSFLIACAGVFLGIGCGGASTPPDSAPPPVLPTGIIVTHHNDNQRTGQNIHETLLTPDNVNSAGFGKVFSYPVDGAIYGEPLYVANLQIQSVRNVVYVVTEHDSVYAFDADNKAPGLLWQVSFLPPTSDITPVPCADEPTAYTFIGTEIGISSTPVIDIATKTLYVCAFTKESGSYVHRLHALDLATGSEKFGGPVPVQGSIAGSGDGTDGTNIAFNPHNHLQRSALLLANGVVYLAFASFDDTPRTTAGYSAMTPRHSSNNRFLMRRLMARTVASGKAVADPRATSAEISMLLRETAPLTQIVEDRILGTAFSS